MAKRTQQKNRSALRGRRATEAVPSVEEFLALKRDSRAAFSAGHLQELGDVILAARLVGDLSADLRALHVGADHSSQPKDGRQPEDPISLPAWAFDVVCNIAAGAVFDGYAPKGHKGKGHWRARYRTSLIDWHRYVLIRRANEAGYKLVLGRKEEDLTAFQVVANTLKGTSFGAGPDAMRKCFERVSAALKRGEHWRYYRSSSFRLYQQLINPNPDVTVIRAPGIHGQSAATAALHRHLADCLQCREHPFYRCAIGASVLRAVVEDYLSHDHAPNVHFAGGLIVSFQH